MFLTERKICAEKVEVDGVHVSDNTRSHHENLTDATGRYLLITDV